jgi:hypothetical protein
VKWGGVVAGILIGCLVLGMLWSANLLAPPERLSRVVAAFYAIYPGSIDGAEIDRIDCPPLRGVRLYTICTRGCEEVWRIVAVRGLRAEPLANPGRLPPEPPDLLQQRFNVLVARERLDLDTIGARRMIACVLSLNGLHPELVLGENDIAAAAAAVGDEEAERAMVERLTASPPADHIEVEEDPNGYRSRLYYWDTARLGRPVVGMDIRMARNGVVRSVVTLPAPITGGTAAGNTPGTPPI